MPWRAPLLPGDVAEGSPALSGVLGARLGSPEVLAIYSWYSWQKLVLFAGELSPCSSGLSRLLLVWRPLVPHGGPLVLNLGPLVPVQHSSPLLLYQHSGCTSPGEREVVFVSLSSCEDSAAVHSTITLVHSCWPEWLEATPLYPAQLWPLDRRPLLPS